MEDEFNTPRVWGVYQWCIMIGLGSFLQTKLSSRIVESGFDSREEALAWAATQDQSEWGFWAAKECGDSALWYGLWSEIPTSYKEALRQGAQPKN